MDGNFCKSVGEDGLACSTAEVLEELLLARCGFVLVNWLCRLVKGGVGGLFMRGGIGIPSSGLSRWTLPEDMSVEVGGNGSGLFRSFVGLVVGL